MASMTMYSLPTAAARAMAAASRRLEGKVAIITGGASGIGEATARLFVENGAFVLIADIQDELGVELARDLGQEAAAYAHCDVTVEEEVEAAVATAVKKWGKVDVMVSNAGTIGKGGEGMEAEEMEIGEFEGVMRVNARGTALVVKHAAKAMISLMVSGGGGGSIICTASAASELGGVVPLDYTASKHAVVGIMRSAASSLAKHGIRVNAVSPTLVRTPLASKFIGQFLRDPHPSLFDSFSTSVCPLRHRHNPTLSPRDVAYASLFLASDESSFVTGLNLVVDGGLTATRQLPTMNA